MVKNAKKTENKIKKISLKKRLGILLLKIFLVIIAITAVYCIYLDQQIRDRIDGTVWELPAAVYGQIIELEPDENISKDDIASILNGVQYRQVLVATRPGEFVVNDDNIEIYRRPFNFPDAQEPAFRTKITFSQNRISRITNIETGRNFGLLRIDPKLITMIHSPNNEQRLFVPLKDFPDSLIQTLVSTEDKRFYQHDGISVYSIFRAVYSNLISGRTVQGGSTLTQQLVKNLFLTNERSYLRKIREAYMAIILDSRYSKERILELYLNEVFLGQNADQEIHGFPLASLYYFGRPVNELTLDQQALLVGMVKGASVYNPWTKPNNTLERRNVVLKLIEEQGIIDDELYQLLIQRPLSVLPKGGVISPQPAFMQLVRQSLREQLGDQANYLSGMKIFTTFDPVTQNAAENAVTEEIERLRVLTKKSDLQTAVTIIDRKTGEVRALIGSADPHYAGFNRALYGRRPIGSLAKPPTYLTALSLPERYQLNTWLDDKPLTVKMDSRTVWQPQNFDKQYRNKVMLVDALAKSLNIPSVNLGMAVGLDATEKTLLSLGVPKREIKAVPSRFLGTLELTALETAQMYQIIGNTGKKSSLSALRYVLSDKGQLIYQSYPNSQQVVSAQASYLTTFAMQQVVNYGTARSLNNNYSSAHLAAKTGTTNDLRDSWFIGIDGKDVTVIWVGLDDHKPMALTGSSGALKIYQTYLSQHTPQPLVQAKPSNINMVEIDAQGNWQCNGIGVRTLPAWTADKALLCAGFNQVPRENVPENDAPSWLKEMFSL
ncbi:bifunctional glycosyl transferase/transpeptidase [Orbus wheelerorum]|uniref:bifunctional glycosyl transferase/transpeptidase n=1 Tax=Orbus wheelerorum TaxID=3074111 RepID=UPI00370DC545